MTYLVESEAIGEARKRENAKFEGIIGKLLPTSTSTESSKTVKFEFDSDDKMVVLALGSDGHFAKFDEEAEMDTRQWRIDPWTGLFSAIPST